MCSYFFKVMKLGIFNNLAILHLYLKIVQIYLQIIKIKPVLHQLL